MRENTFRKGVVEGLGKSKEKETNGRFLL